MCRHFREPFFPDTFPNLVVSPGDFPTRLSTFDHQAEGKRLATATRESSVGVRSSYQHQKVRLFFAFVAISSLFGRSHNPEVAGSSPASATMKKDSKSYDFESFLRLFAVLKLALIFTNFAKFRAVFTLSDAISPLRNRCESPKSTAPSTPPSLSSFGQVTRRSTLYRSPHNFIRSKVYFYQKLC